MRDTLLFDLDGTLVPFVQDDFIAAYFRSLVECIAPMGYDGKQVVAGLWQGISAMQKNNTAYLNHDVFWDAFAQTMGEQARRLESVLDNFYTGAFHAVRATLREERDLSALMAQLRQKGYTLILATNPMFPAVAVEARMSWVGLKHSDFDYVTTYDNSTRCKPDPAYFLEILEKLGKKPEQCFMVGNNPEEDGAAIAAGIETRILTDYLENGNHCSLEGFSLCSFAEMCEELLALPPVNA